MSRHGMLDERDLFGLPPRVRELVLFACTHMSRSYKPVVLSLIVGLADARGRVSIEALAHQFYGFYLNRELLGLPVERRPFALDPPSRSNVKEAEALLRRYPLARFAKAGHLASLGRRTVLLAPAVLASQLTGEARTLAVECCWRAVTRYYDLLEARR